MLNHELYENGFESVHSDTDSYYDYNLKDWNQTTSYDAASCDDIKDKIQYFPANTKPLTIWQWSIKLEPVKLFNICHGNHYAWLYKVVIDNIGERMAFIIPNLTDTPYIVWDNESEIHIATENDIKILETAKIYRCQCDA